MGGKTEVLAHRFKRLACIKFHSLFDSSIFNCVKDLKEEEFAVPISEERSDSPFHGNIT